MRTTKLAARGWPLAALLLLVATLAWGAVAGERFTVEQEVAWVVPETVPEVLPDRADLTVRLTGWAPETGYPFDIMVIVDASASSDVAASKAFAFDWIDRLAPEDRVGVISYGSQAILQTSLTSNRLGAKTVVADLVDAGKSALGDAIRMARQELTATGRDDAVWAILLLSDGQFNVGQDPELEARMAAEHGVRMVCVGIGQLIINRERLQVFAELTGGAYYPRPAESTVQEIRRVLQVESVARDLRVERRLPAGTRVVSANPAATSVETGSDGSTTVQWRISSLRVGQTISLSVRVQVDNLATWRREPDLTVRYTDFRGVAGVQTMTPRAWPPAATFSFRPTDATTIDVIHFSDLSAETELGSDIVRWEWQFGGEGMSTQQHPEFRFVNRGTYTVRLTVVDALGQRSVPYERLVTVGNASPVAGFVLRDAFTSAEITRPHLGVPTVLDAAASNDPDGEIVTYRWDLNGDGSFDVETSAARTEVAFDAPGTRTVTLSVVDDEGRTASVSRALDILPSVIARRTIDTCMPEDTTVPKGVVRVSILVGINTVVNGLSVRETIPAGWTFAAGDNNGATMRQQGDAVEWLFMERFVDDGVNVQREIKYTLTAPESVSDRSAPVSLRGMIGSSSPRVSLPVSGEDRIIVTNALTVPEAISRWDTRAETLDPCLAELIAFDQVQFAVSLWLSGDEVPYTGGAKVELAMMQDLIAYWLTASSVHDPLP